MVNKIFRMYGIPLFSLFIIGSSILLNKAPMIVPLLLAGGFFICSLIFDQKIKVIRLFQFAFLGAFHYFSHLNWCEILYFCLIMIAVQKTPRIRSSLIYSLFVMFEYSAIRLSYQPLSTYNVLVSAYDILGVCVLVSVVQYLIHTEQVKVRLQEHTHYLTTHDPQTGLLNYQGYLDTIQELVDKEQQFVLINMDLRDFKAFNTSGVKNGNDILIKLSSRLKKIFKDALALSRYAGDRFSIALPDKEGLEEVIRNLMNIEHIGFHVTYSVSHFPKEAATASVLISLAEDRLFQNKRSTWLLHEEHRFQEEKLRMVGELAAGMAHEIRNPLTTIKGFMQLSRANDYSMKPWFDLIMSEISRMNELTAEFLQFSKPHISNTKPEMIQHCVNRVLFLTESEAALKGHAIVTEYTEEPLEALVDRDKIVQVLINLMRNAFEAMKQSGTVHVHVYRKNERCLIDIQDSGSGISENDLSKIFDPFYSTKENGTGLGLSICKKIIQDHGGMLEARSKLGEGSVFTITLPIVENSQHPEIMEQTLSAIS